MKLSEITHHTSVPYLFHGTQPDVAANIISSNQFGGNDYTASLARIFGVSLTFSGYNHFPGIVFVINRDVLKRKIGRRLSHQRAIDDYEEEVEGPVTNFDECVVKIFICVTKTTVRLLNAHGMDRIMANPKTEIRLIPHLENGPEIQELLTYRQFLNISKKLYDTAVPDPKYQTKVENFLMHDHASAILYAEKDLKHRWPALEKEILKSKDENAPYYAMEYAKKVLKGRWPVAEPIIASSKYAHVPELYAKNVLKDPEPTTWAKRYLDKEIK